MLIFYLRVVILKGLGMEKTLLIPPRHLTIYPYMYSSRQTICTYAPFYFLYQAQPIIDKNYC